jgi:predicted amidohydrolase
MKLAMAQMSMRERISSNLSKCLYLMERAKSAGAELIFFPELQLTPFFPQYHNKNALSWLMTESSPELFAIRNKCQELALFASPNIYLELDGKRYDASLMIGSSGEILGISKMVHIAQAQNFYEQDYYTPSNDGFKVYDTPFGRIGIVICFDRHIPDGIRTCAKMGAELILISTANIVGEPMELFKWEVCVQAFQSTVFIAMCNRVGTEGNVTFAGESLVCAPDGKLILCAGAQEELIIADVPLGEAASERVRRPWLEL